MPDALKAIMPSSFYRVVAPWYHYFFAAFAALRYGLPSKRLIVIGVTGTNGKTTVVHLLHEMFAAAGLTVGSVSSLRFKINTSEEPNLLKMTMPGRFELQKFLKRALDQGCRYVILEVTSEGIRQSRHRFVHFAGAVLTNITPEHIESHGNFESYRDAKLELFRAVPANGALILNREDSASGLFARSALARVSWYDHSSVEIENVGRPVRITSMTSDHIQLEIEGTVLESSLGGDFNVMNILAAITTAIVFRVSLDAIARGLANVRGIPGRMEYVARHPFNVVVDYAHTPDALEKVYMVLANQESGIPGRPMRADSGLGRNQESRLVCVLGSAGGGRDRWKRPEFGAIAGRFCRDIILTSEDPDDEDPGIIANQIRAGIAPSARSTIDVELDRRAAIAKALSLAKPGDTVIITGMGAQPWFIDRGGKKVPWDEVSLVREELSRHPRT